MMTIGPRRGYVGALVLRTLAVLVLAGSVSGCIVAPGYYRRPYYVAPAYYPPPPPPPVYYR